MQNIYKRVTKESIVAEGNKKRSNGYWKMGLLSLPILAIVLFASLTANINNPNGNPNSAFVLSGNGFRVELQPRLIIKNELTPHSSTMPYFTNVYNATFEDGKDNWSNTATLNTIPLYVYEGQQSLAFNIGNTSLPFNMTLNYNQTSDFMFYLYGQSSIANGYVDFGFSVLHDGIVDVFNYVLDSNGTNKYSFSPVSHLLKYNLTFVPNLWIGYEIQNIRSLLTSYNNSIQFSNITIFNPFFYMRNTQGQAPYYFLDNFIVQTYVYIAQNGIWLNNNVPMTSFQLSLTYTILLNSSILNPDLFILRTDFFDNISTPFRNITNQLVTSMLLGDLVWNDASLENIFDKRADGVEMSPTYPLPFTNQLGNIMNYTFLATYYGGGYDYMNKPYSNSARQTLTGFNATWQVVIPIN